VDTSAADVAKLIAEGNIVTLFQGRSEAGPRALGNRSILFDPTVKDGKDIVNIIKKREWFRPFAGSCLAEKAGEWFDLRTKDETPFMMYAVDVLENKRDLIPAITHVDGTCRVQTVTAEQNKHYYELISEFDKIKGVPILFNTSFNLAGDPLVEKLVEALDTLKRSDMKYLWLPEIGKLLTKE
jgi:carbamoyltransferase